MSLPNSDHQVQRIPTADIHKSQNEDVYTDSYGRRFTPPDFAIKDIYDAIPKHCFQRSTFRGLSYVLRDFVLIATAGYCATYIHTLSFFTLQCLAWFAYASLQGAFMTGIWILAHECGHGAFSESPAICDFVGWILHSLVLIPYFSWKFSHAKHHKHTGSMEKDVVFVPRTLKSKLEYRGKKIAEVLEEAPLFTLGGIIARQLLGWPVYLLDNGTGQTYTSRRKSHFDPGFPLFEKGQGKWVLVSDLGLAIMGFGIYICVEKFGWLNVMLYYGIPYLLVNSNLVWITYLQHTDPSIPHYRGPQWNFVRGAASTIDRDFGFVGRHLFHRIIETHVAHHFVSRMPFYHAEEATVAIRKVMGDAYLKDTTPIPLALWRTARTCQYVPDDGDVVFYRNENGIGPMGRSKAE
ncbi:Delta(12) fatty acid desaturase [Neolecta irregularis DAH-3]|uniref:Delta(12) fatty acid desaturase n=1 Tax=Neolecta irregularis (strain DAH-3) TaxID=1198029 RepID=A0A1U7LKN2_NEOID|nr:Delta(12) fatty acid desaturase [Neolecta irregularis DAH-3]|eukprot:OLL23081.1 Delta(12) fatty acid desaturase [Neolecta irregularis DAH-3]